MEKSDLTAGYHSEGDRTPVHEEKNIDATRHVPDIADPDAGKSDEERAAIVCYIHNSFSISRSGHLPLYLYSTHPQAQHQIKE